MATKTQGSTKTKAGSTAKGAAKPKGASKARSAAKGKTASTAAPQPVQQATNKPLAPAQPAVGGPDLYRAEVRALLDEWSLEITRLRARAQMLTDVAVRIRALTRVEELQRGYNEAYRQYTGMKVDSNAKLEALRATFRSGADAARKAIENLAAPAL